MSRIEWSAQLAICAIASGLGAWYIADPLLSNSCAVLTLVSAACAALVWL